MKKYLLLGAAAALLTTSCSTESVDNTDVDNSGKEKIVLGAGDDQTALISRAGFKEKTRIVARYVSEKRGGGDAKCVTTLLTAKEAGSKTYSDVEYVDTYTRYWDDAYGRNSILSVYAVAIPNQKNDEAGTNLPTTILKGSSTWGTDYATDNTIDWAVDQTQTEALLAGEDLTYSNNIQETGKKGVYIWDYSTGKYPVGADNASEHKYTVESVEKTDGRLYFTQNGKTIKEAVTTDPGHFDHGQMEFHHALSRIQVNLKKGDGYTGTLALTGNLQLNNMPYSGTLDIKAGTWAASPTKGNLNMAQWATADKTAYGVAPNTFTAELTYEAQMLPGYEFTDADNVNAMEFVVDGNTYYITNKMLRAALTSDNYTMQQEKRYIFNITVAKNKIQNITATVAPWVDVTAQNFEINNSHVTFEFKAATGTACGIDDINFYKYEQTLTQVYTDNSYSAPASGTASQAFDGPATLSDSNSDGKFETNWYYKDNKTAYHFRTLNDQAAATFDESSKNKFTMAAGATATTDYHWGAPMIKSDETKLAYSSTDGFAANIEKGIVSASASTNLTIQELHMMSNIVVKLKTVTGSAAINVDNATVTITNLYTAADVDMGTGKITPNTNGNNVMTCGTGDKTKEHTYSVIPQDLDRGSSANPRYVGITIKTQDNNEYYIITDLSTIIAETVTDQRNQTQGQAIKTWFPGHTYIYTFTLSKKQIEAITATVADWVNVTAKDTELDLEK